MTTTTDNVDARHRNPAARLISAVLNTRNMDGFDPSMFHGYPDEARWLANRVRADGQVPSPEAMLHKYPDFPLSETTDLARCRVEVQRAHLRHELSGSIDQTHDRLADGDDAPAALASLQRRLGVIAPATNDAPARPTMPAAAYSGLAVDFIRAVEPHTEADPVALLLSFPGPRQSRDMHQMSERACCWVWLPAWTNAVAKRRTTIWGHRTTGTNQVEAGLEGPDPD